MGLARLKIEGGGGGVKSDSQVSRLDHWVEEQHI